MSRGFTLIELMIVVAIVGILVSVAIPNYLMFQCKSKGKDAGLSNTEADKVCHMENGRNVVDNIAKGLIEVPTTTDVKAHTINKDVECSEQVKELKLQLDQLKSTLNQINKKCSTFRGLEGIKK